MTVQEAKTIFEELLTVPKEMLIKYDSVTDDVQKKKLNDIYLAEQIAIECMQEVEQYRALGTIDGFKKALDGCVEYYNQMKEYKVKLSEYEALGTVEELKKAREKQIQEKWIECPYADLIMCPSCNAEFSTIDNCTEQFEYCPKCGKRLE